MRLSREDLGWMAALLIMIAVMVWGIISMENWADECVANGGTVRSTVYADGSTETWCG